MLFQRGGAVYIPEEEVIGQGVANPAYDNNQYNTGEYRYVATVRSLAHTAFQA